MRTILSLAAGALLSVASLHADTVLINSDLMNESNSLTGANVFVVPPPQWALPPLGAAWVSYTNTGIGAGSFSPLNNTGTPVVVFTETFYLPHTQNLGWLQVWADDTAQVFLDGLALGPAPNFSQGICAIGPIGCEQNEYALIFLNGLSQGSHTLSFDVFQVGGGPLGLLYTGSIDSQPDSISLIATPEPEDILLLLTCFGLVGLRSRRAWASRTRG